MELWGNDLAGGILLQEPYQTKAYQQEIKPPQATPNRFVNMTYLSPAKQPPSGVIGLQDQSNYGSGNLVTGQPTHHHPLLSPPSSSQTLPHPNVPHSFSRGLTMPSLNAQEAYAAAMAGFDTHKIAGHGTLKRMQHHQGYVSPLNSRAHGNNGIRSPPAYLQKSHTDGQLKLSGLKHENVTEGDVEGQIARMGKNSYSSNDSSGTGRSFGLMKHGSSEKALAHLDDSVGKDRAESGNYSTINR